MFEWVGVRLVQSPSLRPIESGWAVHWGTGVTEQVEQQPLEIVMATGK